MTIIAAFCPLSLQTLFNAHACPIKGGNIFVYDAGTTNPRTVYQDAGLALPHTFPVKTNAYGRIPPIWVGVGNYKVVLKDNLGALISSIDNLPGGVDTSAVAPVTPPTGLGTGMVMGAHTDDTYDGWLPLNAKTIGNANSAASARANVDCMALFVLLWNKDEPLVVSGGRGVSASADWAAAKTITLPDYRGRTFSGVDGMGNGLAGVITAFTTSDADTIGTSIGAESDVLTVDQLPTFTPAVTIAEAGGITPTGTIADAGSHDHTGSTDQGGSHSHIIDTSPATALAGGTVRGISGGGLMDQGTEANGVHLHTFTTALAGDHTHGLTINPIPDHTHTATAAPIGSDAAHSEFQPTILGYWHIKI